MRRIGSRIAALMSIAALLAMALAGPASAAQLIRYEGTTSASDWNEGHAYVLKRDSGRRILHYIAFQVTITCEDAAAEQWTLIVVMGRRLGDDGEFSRTINSAEPSVFIRIDGSFDWGGGNGTAVWNQAKLTADGSDAQLCTTGELTWVMDRTDAQPARVTNPDIPDGTGLLKVRVKSGVAKIVKLVEPTEMLG